MSIFIYAGVFYLVLLLVLINWPVTRQLNIM